MDIIKCILLVIFIPFALVVALGLVLKASTAACEASRKLKPKILGKLVTIIANTVLILAILAYAASMIMYCFFLSPFSL